MYIIRRDPQTMGYKRGRWTLAMLLAECDWLHMTSEGGMSQLLSRLGIRYKRGREYVHSPDRHYQDKLNVIQVARQQAWDAPERYVFLYQDEFTIYRQPSLANAYEVSGPLQPLARRSYRSDTQFRGIATLNALTGQVTYRQHSKIKLRHLSDFYAAVRDDYPEAEVIYIVQDNWPVHFHVDVLARLQPQHFPFPPTVPPNWPTQPTRRAIHDELPIQLLCLPTYASWLNPIEKLWRWCRQEILHLHRLSDAWPVLKQHVLEFMSQFRYGSTDLLHYVGLWSD